MEDVNSRKFPKTQVIKSGLFFRNAVRILKDPLSFLSGSVKNNGPVIKLNLAGKKYYLIQDPVYVKKILVDQSRLYQKTTGFKLVRSFLGEGLSATNGEVWAKQRRIINPAFHRQKLEGMADLINEETTLFIRRLETHDKNLINFTNEFFQLTMAITSHTLFHTEPEEVIQLVKLMEDMRDHASRWMKSFIKIPSHWPTPDNIRYRRNLKAFNQVIYGLINRRKAERADPHKPRHNDLLDMLIDQQDGETDPPMTDKNLRDEITVLLVAGHETSTHTLSWVVYHLAKDKDLISKIRQESELMLGNSLPNYESISKLTYTRQVIHEALRSYPPFWIIARQNSETDVLNGVQLPAGSNVLINVYGLHHHPSYWQQPDVFDPSRFDQAIDNKRPPYVFIPFGAGPRLCVGHNFAMMEMLIIINRIARTLDLEIPAGYVAEVEPNITLKAKGGMQLRIKKLYPVQESDPISK